MIIGLRHVQYLGWILGIARGNGIPLEPVVDPLGNYTDRLEGHWILEAWPDAEPIRLKFTIVVPPPPDDWVLP